MTRKKLRSLSSWIFILAVILVLTALFFLHWALGALGVGILLWNLSSVLWTWSITSKSADDEK